MPNHLHIILSLLSLPFLSCNPESETKATAKVEKDTTTLSKEETDVAFPSKEELTKNYSFAIAEYMKACYDRDKTHFDSLYIGKHPDFPEIELPERIGNTVILLTPEGTEDLPSQKTIVYLNVIGDIREEYSIFNIVTFHVKKDGETYDYYPQHNCLFQFKSDPETKELKSDLVRFEFPYPQNN